MDLHKDNKRKKKKFTSVKKLLHSFSFHKGHQTKLSTLLPKSKSCSHISLANNKETQLITPGGCFAVYVGSEKQRFVIKAKYSNHPMFKMLLEDAELEYGFNSDGPILLPCDVDLFYKVLAEMDYSRNEIIKQSRFGKCSPFTPTRGKGYYSSSYALLTPSTMSHS